MVTDAASITSHESVVLSPGSIAVGDAVNDENRPAILDWAKAHPGAYLLVPRASAADFESVAVIAGDLVGFNYSDGDPVDHVLMRINR